MRDKYFVDTNLFIYGLVQSSQEHEHWKTDSFRNCLTDVLSSAELVVSSQIVNECHFVMVRKFKIDDAVAYRLINDGILSVASVEAVTPAVYHQAFELRKVVKVSFWDSLALASALSMGCTRFYSEDMQHGLVLSNQMTIVNPFITT
ncbi:PIN domain-containing protein [Thiomicrospira microaerophila]|uniref:PIN domain-containing protein n=1 Tax=Thiomicrospira microaerophila TaxID=406020 RepID=UPI0009FCB7FA|nr:PIN domain-containing protein [Thiomicrospira microaerophila]